MEGSILTSIKKVLGISADDTSFDEDVLLHVNSVFSTLDQLGIGPVGGFSIEDTTATWSDFLGSDERYNAVRTYVFLRVRLLFDPPTTSYHITALKEQITELEWRLNVTRENQLAGVISTPPLITDNHNGSYTIRIG